MTNLHETIPDYTTLSFNLHPLNTDADTLRLAVISKSAAQSAGTIDISGGDTAILRIDLVPEYSGLDHMEELLKMIVLYMLRDLHIHTLTMDIAHRPDIAPLLLRYGFVPSDMAAPGNYVRTQAHFFDADKGVAYCGLACCVCSENEQCLGCRMDGCANKDWCKNRRCCMEQALEGCWQCSQFPCKSTMLEKTRVRAFAAYIRDHGAAQLIQALGRNESSGVMYHHPGKLTGDYDIFEHEDEIIRFIDGIR